MNSSSNPLLARLRHHVTGAIERGEAVAVVEVAGPTKYESKAQPGLFFWADRLQTPRALALCGTVYSVFAQVDGAPVGEASDDWFCGFADADSVAQQLAAGTFQP